MGAGLTQIDCAERLGISTRQLRALSGSDGPVPRNEDGSYPWPECQKAYVAFKQQEKLKRTGHKETSEYEQARARKVAAQARLAELEVLQREGELIALSDVEQMVRGPLEQVDAALRNVPARYASELAAAAKIKVPTAMELLEAVIERIRADLRALGDLDGDDDAAAA